jgi:Mg2+-importing ATPase
LWISTLTVVAIGWILPGTSLGKMFNLAALPLPAIVMLAGIVLVYLIFVEIGKKIFYSKLYAS